MWGCAKLSLGSSMMTHDFFVVLPLENHLSWNNYSTIHGNIGYYLSVT